MKLLTVAGDSFLLKFRWPPWAMHDGRQAARYAAERGAHVRKMRTGEEAETGFRITNMRIRRGPATFEYAEVIDPLTEAERRRDKGELFVRERYEPMHNEKCPGANTVGITITDLTKLPGGEDRAIAILRTFANAIGDHIGTPCNVEFGNDAPLYTSDGRSNSVTDGRTAAELA